MKHSKLITLGLLLVLQQTAWAVPRSYRQAQAIAERQAAKLGITISKQARAKAFSKAASAASTGKESPYYVFPYGNDNGFVIVSGDDQMPEIVAYSDKGSLDENNMSDGCREFLSAYKQMTEAVAQGDVEAQAALAQQREFLAAKEASHPVVAPLLGDIAWTQQSPFNDQCPYSEKQQKRCLSGCAAIAMAQVFGYWRYPKTLKEDIPSYYVFAINSDISQIDKGAVYDWDNILPQYTAGNYTEEQAAAVAQLVFHCGAAVEMEYSTSGSSTNLTSMDVVPFTKYFGYDPDLACLVHRQSYTLTDWCELIDNELEAKRPIIYSGFSTVGGHSFVCDGADGKGLYHINWGWGGENNGYFDIAILKWTNKNNESGFNDRAYMIIGLMPDNGVTDEPLAPAYKVEEYNSDFNIIEGTRSSLSDPFTVTYTLACTYRKQPDDDSGDFIEALGGIGIKDATGKYVPIGDSFQSIPDKNTYTISYAFPVGTTSLYAIYSTDGGKTWRPCLYSTQKDVIKVSATETTLSQLKDNDDFEVTLKAKSDLVVKKTCRFTYTMTNPNAHDHFGGISIYISDTPTKPEKSYCQDYVDIAAGGTTTHEFAFIPSEATDYYVWICDDTNGKVLVDGQKFTASSNPTGISDAPTTSSAADGLQVSAGKGMLSITAAQAQTVEVFNMAGQYIRRVSMKAGSTVTLTLPSGVYMIGNKKVMVK